MFGHVRGAKANESGRDAKSKTHSTSETVVRGAKKPWHVLFLSTTTSAECETRRKRWNRKMRVLKFNIIVFYFFFFFSFFSGNNGTIPFAFCPHRIPALHWCYENYLNPLCGPQCWHNFKIVWRRSACIQLYIILNSSTTDAMAISMPALLKYTYIIERKFKYK